MVLRRQGGHLRDHLRGQHALAHRFLAQQLGPGAFAQFLGGQGLAGRVQGGPRLQANAAAPRQQLLSLSAQSEARLAAASNVAVFSLSDRLDYLVSGFNLGLVGGDAREDAAWTPEASAAFAQQLKALQPAAVLHHREVPPALAQAVQQASVRLIVLQTEGRDPLGDLRTNAERLGAIAQR